MALFNSFYKKSSDTEEKHASEIPTPTKAPPLANLICAEEARIDTLYIKLGRAYFESHANSEESEFAEILNELRYAHNTLKGYIEQDKKERGIVSCERCGADIDADSVFCSSCGARKISKLPREIICTLCGNMAKEGQTFCTKCGARIIGDDPVIVPPVITLDETDTLNTIGSTLTENAKGNDEVTQTPEEESQTIQEQFETDRTETSENEKNEEIEPIVNENLIYDESETAKAADENLESSEAEEKTCNEPESVFSDENNTVEESNGEETVESKSTEEIVEANVSETEMPENITITENSNGSTEESEETDEFDRILYEEDYAKVIFSEDTTWTSSKLLDEDFNAAKNTSEADVEETDVKPVTEDSINEGSNICANCGATVGKGYLFCIKCGTKIEKKKPNCCPSCQKETAPDALFCIYCGTKL